MVFPIPKKADSSDIDKSSTDKEKWGKNISRNSQDRNQFKCIEIL
jgi:hypothetical protein